MTQKRYPPLDKAEHFWKKVHRSPATQCWTWYQPTRAQTTFSWVEGSRPHHKHYAVGIRRASLHFSGREIHEGWHLHSTCGNPDCVNPDHIEQLPPRDSRMKYVSASQRQRAGRPPHLTFDDREILDIWNSSESNPACARRYGVAVRYIVALRLGKFQRRDVERVLGPQTQWGQQRIRKYDYGTPSTNSTDIAGAGS